MLTMIQLDGERFAHNPALRGYSVVFARIR